jgi:hypothetical protein
MARKFIGPKRKPTGPARGRNPKMGVVTRAENGIIWPSSKASRNESFKRSAGIQNVLGATNREEALSMMSPGDREIAKGKTLARAGQPFGERNRYLSFTARAHGSVSRTKALYANPNNPFR